MSNNVEVFPGAHRDWLVPNEGRPYSANVVTFSPKLLQCSICSSRHHRASSCPNRPRKASTPPCAND